MHQTIKNIAHFRMLWPAFVALLLILSPVRAEIPEAHDMAGIHDRPLGQLVYYLKESSEPLSFADVLKAHKRGLFVQGSEPVLTFGIGAKPVWIHLPVENNTTTTTQRTFVLDTSWLDQIEVYIQHRGTGALSEYHTGDTYPHAQRPQATRTYSFIAEFPPGITDIYTRVATSDPMVIPMYLLNEHNANAIARSDEISYGFIYGYLLALLAYNAMLYFGLRDRRYLLYALYLGVFTLANISYTGHAFMWLWPGSPFWQQWAQPLLIILYGCTGLAFALKFLDIKEHSRKLYNATLIWMGIIMAGFMLTLLLSLQTLALLISFGFISVFVVLMLLLGIVGYIKNNPSARYFLLAAFAGLMGTAITTLSTWGFIPFNDWTFRAVEIGMLIEATLLALALTHRLRIAQEKQQVAEKLAQIDSLTQLSNRRSFYDKAIGIWSAAERHNRMLSIILFDLDGFKAINDNYGHMCGDQALVETGKVLLGSIRRSDIAARWGGEEFILLLPESGLQDAMAFAERLREKIATLNINCGNQLPRITASFGVVQRLTSDVSIDAVITRADKALYAAKDKGKNTVATYIEERPAKTTAHNQSQLV